MTATLYIIKDMDAYRFGRDPLVKLWEPEFLSRQWIRRVTVTLPEGYQVKESNCGEPNLYHDGEQIAYELGTNKAEEPVIIDHKNNGRFIRLPILSEGWDVETT